MQENIFILPCLTVYMKMLCKIFFSTWHNVKWTEKIIKIIYFINFQKIHRDGGSIKVYNDYKKDYLETIVIEDKTVLVHKDYLESWKSSSTLEGKKKQNKQTNKTKQICQKFPKSLIKMKHRHPNHLTGTHTHTNRGRTLKRKALRLLFIV